MVLHSLEEWRVRVNDEQALDDMATEKKSMQPFSDWKFWNKKSLMSVFALWLTGTPNVKTQTVD